LFVRLLGFVEDGGGTAILIELLLLGGGRGGGRLGLFFLRFFGRLFHLGRFGLGGLGRFGGAEPRRHRADRQRGG
jgi:hypothetical protein